MDLVSDFFARLPRQGPGSDASTLRALNSVGALPEEGKILDIGCGTGAQTLLLARQTQCKIIAVDVYPAFLNRLEEKAGEAGLNHLIQVENLSMDAMNFDPESFDLIWSEGAIYIMGFENGLRNWRPFLKPGGFLGVSEVVWTKSSPPEELLSFWQAEYPDIQTVKRRLQQIAETGLNVIDHFLLPASDWWDNYYRPALDILPQLRAEKALTPDDHAFLDGMEKEIKIFRKYANYYSYVFFIMQNPRDDN